MSFATDRIKALQDLAVRYALEADPVLKQHFAVWLNSELVYLDEHGLVTPENEVDFYATVKIMLERLIPQEMEDDA